MLAVAMRSGAFLHLVVTLTALVARLAHLTSALRHVLSALHTESIRFLDTLHVRTTQAFIERMYARTPGLTTTFFHSYSPQKPRTRRHHCHHRPH